MKHTDDLDRLTQKVTAFASFADLVGARRFYRPTLRQDDAAQNALALAYDAHMRRAKDDRRAYPERTPEAIRATARRKARHLLATLKKLHRRVNRGRRWDAVVRLINRTGTDLAEKERGDYWTADLDRGKRPRIYRVSRRGPRGAIYGRRITQDGRVSAEKIIGHWRGK